MNTQRSNTEYSKERVAPVMRGVMLCVSLLLPGAALAHAAMVKSTPGSRDTLSHSPSLITLKFNEGVEPRFSSVTLETAKGAKVPLGALRLSVNDPTQIELAVPQPLGSGTYTVRYRVLSKDGHVVEYGYQFRVLAPAGNDD